jgi:hypothetical protein
MARKKKTESGADAVEETIIAYKGFDKDMSCRGMKYEIGTTYTADGAVRCGEVGFHSCENPLDVWNYYGPAISRFAVVTAGGKIDRNTNSDSKIASAKITVTAEIALPEFIQRAVAWIGARAKGNLTTGNYSAAVTTGDYSAAVTTGDYSAAATTGDYSAAATTGDYSAAATTGNYSAAVTTGNGSAAVTTGYDSAAATTGDYSAAATTGYDSAAATTGKHSIAASLGRNGTAKAGPDGWLVLSAWNDEGDLVLVKSAKVGTEGIEPGKFYRLLVDGTFQVAE